MDRPALLAVFASDAARRRALLHLSLVAFVLLALRPRLSFLADAEAVRAHVREFGAWAPLAFVALQAAQVVLAPIPGQVLTAVGGYLFGP